MPARPEPPQPPELSEKLFEINAEFRARKNTYFRTTRALNWASWAAALALAGGLLYLLMFDQNGVRLYYLAALLIAFVFMIGPSFHSIITAVVGFLEAPSVH